MSLLVFQTTLGSLKNDFQHLDFSFPIPATRSQYSVYISNYKETVWKASAALDHSAKNKDLLSIR